VTHTGSGVVLADPGSNAGTNAGILVGEVYGVGDRDTLQLSRSAASLAPSTPQDASPRVPLDEAMGVSCGGSPFVDMLLVLDGRQVRTSGVAALPRLRACALARLHVCPLSRLRSDAA